MDDFESAVEFVEALERQNKAEAERMAALDAEAARN